MDLPAIFRFRRTALFYVTIGLSAASMVVGHWAVLASGVFFDQKSQTHYDLYTRWVSDFAAEWPHGWIIKISILLFCLGLAHLFSLAIASSARGANRGLMKFWWQTLALLMIGGLLLVITFDMSPARYFYHGPTFWDKIFGRGGEYQEIRRTGLEWVERGHHELGFQLFVTGFFLSAISLGIAEWRHRIRDLLPTTVFLILLAGVLAGWLFLTKTTIAGVPQRALLLLILFWVLRNESSLRRRL